MRAVVSSRTPVAEQLLAGVAESVEAVFASVETLRVAMVSIVQQVEHAGHTPALADLADLRPAVTEVLARHAGFVAGAGVVTAPGVLSDAPLWIDWYWASEATGPERLEVDLDPASSEFWDYTTLDWYREPEHTGQPYIAGPYVDYICTHDYTLTLSTPLLDRDRFIGIAGADILASQLERRVLPALSRLRFRAALATASGRVVASNSPDLLPGMLLARSPLGAALEPVMHHDSERSAPPLPWVLFAEAGAER